MKVDEFDIAVEIFNQGGAAFNPISAVQIFDAVNCFRFGAVDVPADHAIGLLVARHGGKRALVFGDKFHRRFRFEFQIASEGPIAKATSAAQPVEI